MKRHLKIVYKVQITDRLSTRRLQVAMLYFVLLILLLSSCNQKRGVIQKHIPNRDIVFQFDNIAKDGPDQVGFINADGSNLIFLESTPYTFFEPQWAGVDNRCLLVTHSQGFLSCLDKTGRLSRIRPGESLGGASPIPDKNEIYIVRSSSDHKGTVLHRINLISGEFLQTFPSVDNWAIDLGTNAQTGNLVVYSRTQYDKENNPQKTELVVFNLKDMTTRVLVQYEIEDPVADASILNPAISPDGRWVVYTTSDGLHLIHPDGSGDKLLVSIPDWNFAWPVYTWAPKASWSPDSQWIVYHQCVGDSCIVPDRTGRAIYKINVDTKKTKLLVKGGINPYWKLSE